MGHCELSSPEKREIAGQRSAGTGRGRRAGHCQSLSPEDRVGSRKQAVDERGIPDRHAHLLLLLPPPKQKKTRKNKNKKSNPSISFFLVSIKKERMKKERKSRDWPSNSISSLSPLLFFIFSKGVPTIVKMDKTKRTTCEAQGEKTPQKTQSVRSKEKEGCWVGPSCRTAVRGWSGWQGWCPWHLHIAPRKEGLGRLSARATDYYCWMCRETLRPGSVLDVTRIRGRPGLHPTETKREKREKGEKKKKTREKGEKRKSGKRPHSQADLGIWK
jgi:hypothetical protein